MDLRDESVFLVSDRFMRLPGADPRPDYSHSFVTGAAWSIDGGALCTIRH